MLTTPGIVLNSIRYNDTQLIVTVFTEQAGTVPFLLRRPRARRGGLRAVGWQPLSLVEATWQPQERRSLQKPAEFALLRPWTSLPFHPYKSAMSLFLGEFLYHALHREGENAPLFQFMLHSLEWFDESEAHFVNFHVVFLLHLTRFLGFYPNVDDWHEGCFFDMQNATFTPARPLHPHFIGPDEAALVPKFMRMDLRKMRAVGLSGAVRSRVLALIADFYRLHTPEFPELKSLGVLAEVFA